MTSEQNCRLMPFGRRLGGEQDGGLVAEMLDQRGADVYGREPEARPVSRFSSTQRS